MLRVGNFVPAISVEGDAEATNGRRGENVYERLTKGMEILKRNKLPFGISAVTRAKTWMLSALTSSSMI